MGRMRRKSPGGRQTAFGTDTNFKTALFYVICSNRNSLKTTRRRRPCLSWNASMKSNILRSMSIEEMWSLHEQISSTLTQKMAEQRDKLEERLRRLENPNNSNRPRRPYPRVLPKYQNPKNPDEKWSGRGKQPHWVQAQLKAGKKARASSDCSLLDRKAP